MREITSASIDDFRTYLISEEKAAATVEKYLRDVTQFFSLYSLGGITREDVLCYKRRIMERYSATGANSVLSSLNGFFTFMGWSDLKIKTAKVQRQLFSATERELTKAEYSRLLSAAQRLKNQRLYFLMQSICSTGIRVSEIKYITVESLHIGRSEIINKGKRRTVFLPAKLCTALKKYAKKCNIKSGPVFITKNGKPLDRSNIWSAMKKLCKSAQVSASKVFPHNLRHLFARTYYSVQKDIVRLADLLGHSNVNTTRIYTMETGEIHRQQIQNLGLLRC